LQINLTVRVLLAKSLQLNLRELLFFIWDNFT
jgi:hypothetical protein